MNVDFVAYLFYRFRKSRPEILTGKYRHRNIHGKTDFSFFLALVEFERNLIVEKINAGLQAARARGIKGGRKKT